MKNKFIVWLFLIVFLSSSILLGNATVADNEPWGEFYTPTSGKVSDIVEVSFYVDGYSDNITIDLYYEDQMNSSSIYLATFYGRAVFNYSWDSNSVENGYYHFKLDVVDNQYASANVYIYSNNFEVDNSADLPPIPTGATYIRSFYTGGERGITHDDNYLYVAAVSDIYVYQINTSTLVRTLSTSYGLMGLAHDGQYLYAADSTSSGYIHRLDPISGNETGPTIPGTTCDDLAGITFLNDDFWLTRYSNQVCSKFNLSTGMFTTHISLTLGNSWGLANDGYHLFIVGGGSGGWSGVPTINVYASDLESKVAEFSLDHVQNWQGLTYWDGKLYLHNSSGYTHEFALQYETPSPVSLDGNKNDYAG
ncbi:MAG: YncE family protein, partial [Candidatus Hodarchaeales archaeon]